MQRLVITSVFVGCFFVFRCDGIARSEVVTDSKLGFTLTLPPDFVSLPDLTPGIVHAFQYGDAKEGEVAVVLAIEKLGGTIGQERLKEQDIPPGSNGKLFATTWQGFEVDGIEIRETVNGTDVVTYSVQIPLKGEAIQVKLVGPGDREEDLKRLLEEILGGLKGESNWLSSSAASTVPSSAPVAESEDYGTLLLCVGIGGVIVGLVVLYFVSRRAPKGTVLAIAAVIYALSWQIGSDGEREGRLLSGSLRMLGFAGGLLGFVDLFRKRKLDSAIEQTDEG